MRRLTIAALLCVLVLAPTACKRRKSKPTQEGNAAPAQLSSLLGMADPNAAVQLVRGFYDPEEGSWRWTARQFSVVLHPPANAKEKGALLILKLDVPEVSIERLKTITLSASINSTALAPETFAKAGDYTYQRDVPAAALSADSVPVDFVLDKALAPSGNDRRELGIVAQSVGFEAK